MSPLIFRSALLVLLLFGCGMTSVYWDIIHKGKETNNWVEITGKVTRSEVLRNQTSKGVSWCPQVTVEYQFNDHLFETKNLGIGQGCDIVKANATRFTDKYKLGTTVPVIVNPAIPAEAVLQRGVGWLAYFEFILGLYLIAFGLVAFFPQRIVRKICGKKP